ncbi:hypothetical protein LINGRAHAP2_LOCUS27741 [Linum grandiflorum]
MVACNCFPTYNGEGQYEVQHHDRTFVVDLTGHDCACGKWQLSGLPCEHAISCISINRESIVAYVAPVYKVATYRRCYEVTISPLNNHKQWESFGGPTLQAPLLHVPTPGPNQKKRRIEDQELIVTKKKKQGQPYKVIRKVGMIQHCSVCKKAGHNERAHAQEVDK